MVGVDGVVDDVELRIMGPTPLHRYLDAAFR